MFPHGGGSTIGLLIALDALQPELAPVGWEGARAVESAPAEFTLTDHPFQDHARLFHFNHLPGGLVHDVRDFPSHPDKPITEEGHLPRVKTQTPVLAAFVDRFLNLLLGLDS